MNLIRVDCNFMMPLSLCPPDACAFCYDKTGATDGGIVLLAIRPGDGGYGTRRSGILITPTTIKPSRFVTFLIYFAWPFAPFFLFRLHVHVHPSPDGEAKKLSLITCLRDRRYLSCKIGGEEINVDDERNFYIIGFRCSPSFNDAGSLASIIRFFLL